MGQIAFLFSGQGDQFPGMGRELAQQHSEAAEVFARCDSLRPGTSAQCFDGTDEELRETKNTQPCLFALELASAAVLTAAGIQPAAAAGFSLGEVVACAALGAVDLETGFRLVCKRGELMQREAERFDTAMAAVVKLPEETVERLCDGFSEVYPVNFNCPEQITVAGISSEMPAFSAAVKEAGGRALPLKVRAGFHSPFMNDASTAFAQELSSIAFAPAAGTLYSNVTGQPYDGQIRTLLAKQICSPVRWEATIRHMIASGVDTFIEIGPGKTLTNMMKRIDPAVRAFAACDLETVLAEVAPC